MDDYSLTDVPSIMQNWNNIAGLPDTPNDKLSKHGPPKVELGRAIVHLERVINDVTKGGKGPKKSKHLKELSSILEKLGRIERWLESDLTLDLDAD